MRDIGEPLSRGQVDRGAVEARALREAMFAVAVFSGVILVNGILAIVFIALLQAVGLWGAGAVAAEGASLARVEEMRSGLQALVPPTSSRSPDS